ncbi:MAG: ABC transporter ATP-binding protein [Planctomycetes bacterium]|nr:ABC transporter ATP-binding protein [Planctomycetota bacterium]
MDSAIFVRNLTKRFKDKVAVDNVTFQVGYGEFFGFLGPNGAGKTTTIKILCGLMKADSGEAHVAGLNVLDDPLAVKAKIGVLPDVIDTFDRLTGNELAVMSGLLYGLKEDEAARRAGVLFELMDLKREDREKLVIDYSLGMRKKVGLACALIHGPKVLFLDEPFNGIDPVATAAVQRVLQNLVARGVTIFFTSHVLEVVEKLCTRVGIIQNGGLLACGTIAEVAQSAGMAPGSTLSDVFNKIFGAQAGEGRDLDWVAGLPPAIEKETAIPPVAVPRADDGAGAGIAAERPEV